MIEKESLFHKHEITLLLLLFIIGGDYDVIGVQYFCMGKHCLSLSLKYHIIR
jgi:hypothetical protein